MKKHLLFLFAALLPMLASAQTKVEIDGIWYKLTSETKQAEVTSGGNYSGSITIPATITYDGVDYNVTSIGERAFSHCSLTAIILPAGVTNIGKLTFADCLNLTAITIPEGVTSIGSYAFYGCIFTSDKFINNSTCSSEDNWGASLFEREYDGVFIENNIVVDCRPNVTIATIPEGVTSIGDGAFHGCSSLTAITIPEGVTSIGRLAFSSCSSLTSITIPEGVTSIGDDAFLDCSSLTAITIPESVTSIGEYAFYNCSSLTTITIPEGVTSIGERAFYDCSSLTEVYCYAECVPEAGTSSFSNAKNATLYVPASAIGDYLNTAPWSSFGWIKALGETVGAVANGEYYLYHADSHRFLSRGEYWGTCATVDKYGVPFVWTADEYSLQFLDSNVRLFETDGSSIYTDNATTGFDFEAVEGGYLLKSLKSDRYLTIVDHQIVSVANDASAAVVWQLKSKAEHDAIVAGYVEENYRNVIAAAGITATAGDFADYLATLEAEDKTSAIGTARFNGNAGEWIFAEGRHQDNQPAIGTDFCELWQATGSYTQTITNLPEGIYKVTMQGFERSSYWGVCDALGDRGYEITIATLCANGEQVNLKSWYSGKSGDNNPNSTDEAVAKFNEGKYMNEVYTYVGTDSTLTITVNKPSYVFDNWILFNNFTLTRYALAVEEITLSKETATLTEGDALTLVAVVSPDNATDKNVTWSTSDDKVATVDENGKIIAIAPGTAIITATSGDKSATCKVVVEAASYVFTLKVEDEEYFTQTVKRGTNLATLMAKHEVATPTKVGYTFSGWEVPETMPANNLTLNGTFTINKYLVTFKIGEEVIISDSLEYGAAIVAPEAPKKEGHTFIGWNNLPATMPASDVDVEALFKINKYCITYVIDNVVIATEFVEYGADIVLMEPPVKDGYTFAGWSYVPEKMPATDIMVIGVYTTNSYRLTYLVDGEVYNSDIVECGTSIVLPQEPVKEGYTFSGWDAVPEVMPDHEVVIKGSFVPNKYLVTFKIDGVIISSESLEYGSSITVPNVPEREGYTFNGWGEVAETVPATDVTYEGSYTINSYLLTFIVDGEIMQNESVQYGSAIVAPEPPVKEGHTFSGWSEVPETMPASDVTVTGSFSINTYVVTFMVDGVVVSSKTLEYGAAITAPTMPEREGYTFSGWSNVDATVPAGDVTYHATYTANTYNVYYFVGATLVHIAEVAYGETIPEYIYEPTIEGDVFMGWIGEAYDTMPAHDVTYTANIMNGIENSETNIQNSVIIYDLTGRKVTDTENLKGGIYIINGRKVVIK